MWNGTLGKLPRLISVRERPMWGRDSDLSTEAKFVSGAQESCRLRMRNPTLNTSLCVSKSYCPWTSPPVSLRERSRSLQPGAGDFQHYLHTHISHRILPHHQWVFLVLVEGWGHEASVVPDIQRTGDQGPEGRFSDPLPTSLYFVSFVSLFINTLYFVSLCINFPSLTGFPCSLFIVVFLTPRHCFLILWPNP